MSHHLKKWERRNELPTVLNYFEDDFFSNFFDTNKLPAINVKETKKTYTLELSIPGFAKEDIRVDVDRNVLNISAFHEKSTEEKGEDEKIWRREFATSSFTRNFVLPENIDTEKIEATEKSGILKIVLPKVEKSQEDKIKKIEIR